MKPMVEVRNSKEILRKRGKSGKSGRANQTWIIERGKFTAIVGRYRLPEKVLFSI